MKKQIFLLAGIALLFALLTDSCCKPCETASCCQGYTGTVTDTNAIKLVARNHFILKDSIIAWVNRWNANKSSFPKASLVDSVGVVGVDHSFNRCLIKAILCDDSCIGLRVLTGQSADLKVHNILVGILPDYTNLYIPEQLCGNDSARQLKSLMKTSTGTQFGGAENSLDP